ncbi:Uncharacterised protein [[Clostridium] sordellii]|uniref:hypothetical protein n=1 Tax=Paraclostridium sordellii TaxID=1505 RepID=UPI0005DE410F|nr:hypothetical protein [Paeniclostridium sordellii]CEN75429.1 Uncharacterised protein [[Clostridium] sordellii] [Paeniclostridium sordellii]
MYIDSDFIKKSMDFLANNQINFKLPIVRPVTIENGVENIQMSFSDSIGMCSRKNSISDNFIAKNILIFTVFDEYLNSKNDNLIGLSFRKRYNLLSANNDLDIITKEIYRILKLIRNTIVHNSSNISINKNTYNFNYENNNTKFNLNIDEKTLNNLYTIVYMIVREYSTYKNESNEFYIGILRYCYSKLKLKIDREGCLKDDINDNPNILMSISSSIKLFNTVRYKVRNPKYTVNGDMIKIETIDTGIEYYKEDYCLNIDDNYYIVPSEALNNLGEIKKLELTKWKIR